jgi:N-acetylmuramoyl-L-alanine amidase
VHRRTPFILVSLGVVVAAGLAFVVGDGDGGSDQADTGAGPTSATTATKPTTAPTTTTPAPTTTTAPPSAWPPLAAGGPVRAVVTVTGLTLPVLADRGDGTYDVQTPCGNTAVVTGTPLTGAHIVLDPGHGGEEPGAVGPNGLTEKELNLTIALLVADALRAQGATVVLTRDHDVRVTLATRALLATNLAPVAFVSIHHNAQPDGPSPVPGTEVYFQVSSEPSRRLAGLIVDEVRTALGAFPADWASDVPNGALARVRQDGTGDFYGILRRGGSTTTVLSEAAYLSNPTEADLLARPDVQQAEAGAIARGIERFQRNEAPTESAYAPGGPLTAPAGGPGGGSSGCDDPPL